MRKRLTALKRSFKDHSIDALLVTDDSNIRYVTGHPASDSWLLLTHTSAYYITDFRYIEEVKAALKGIRVHDHKGRLMQSVFELAKLDRCKRIGFDESHISVSLFRSLKKSALQGQKLCPANGLIENLRVVKDKDEVAAVKKALKIHAEALKYVKRILKPGITELEAYAKLANFVQSRNAGFSFDPIIAGGANSALPHAIKGKRKVRKNDVVMVDFGIDLNGYKSDLTRMFYFGKISKLVEDVSTYVADAQREAIKKIAHGVRVSEVDKAARNYLAKHNLDRYFGHALGHGVGLQIHEAPRLSQKSDEVLRSGMIVTVEPAVYLPSKFGVRLEEMVLVKKDGCEVLSDHIN